VDLTPGYREFAPPMWLRATLSCLWIGITSPARSERTLVLPDGCADLMWYQGAPAQLAGPDTGPAPVVAAPGSVIVGARFLPGAGGPVLGLPLTEIADQRTDPGQLPALRGRMPSPDLPPHLALAALARLVAGLAVDRPADESLIGAVRRLARPGASADEVAGTLDLSERQFRRRCQSAIGYGPRTLQRVIRFRRFVSAVDAAADAAAGTAGPGIAVAAGTAVAAGPGSVVALSGGRPLPGSLADLAVAAGYADQPHLTRECVRLSGLTPAGLVRARLG
jgi:AraC-like DNA-binding protein